LFNGIAQEDSVKSNATGQLPAFLPASSATQFDLLLPAAGEHMLTEFNT
jgi:hypothetical protein